MRGATFVTSVAIMASVLSGLLRPYSNGDWKGSAVANGNDVIPGEGCAIFNLVVGDYLFYDPRRYGINLKWLKDKGKYNSTPWHARVANTLSGWGSFLFNTAKELVNRAIGAVDFVLTFFGIMIPKKLRIQIVILRDESDHALLGDEETLEPQRQDEIRRINDAIGLARDVFKRQVNTSLRSAGEHMIVTLDTLPPAQLSMCTATSMDWLKTCFKKQDDTSGGTLQPIYLGR